MKKLFGAVAIAATLMMTSTTAFAGGSLKDSYEPVRVGCESGKFGGAYIGVNVGAGRTWAEQDLNGGAEILKGHDTFFVGGGQMGYNWQCGRHVFGIEGDVGFGTSKVDTVDGNAALSAELTWFSTLRARYGVVLHDHMLLYVTGGLAVAAVDHSVVGINGIVYQRSDKDTNAGWTLGAGMEFARERWNLRAEALYVDLRDTSRTYVAGGCGVVCTGSAKWDDDFLMVRIGLNFKLGDHERHVPLK